MTEQVYPFPFFKKIIWFSAASYSLNTTNSNATINNLRLFISQENAAHRTVKRQTLSRSTHPLVPVRAQTEPELESAPSVVGVHKLFVRKQRTAPKHWRVFLRPEISFLICFLNIEFIEKEASRI